MLVFVDAHAALSIDSLFMWGAPCGTITKKRHIPAWHLYVFRGLAFVVYFVAGLKKVRFRFS